MKDLGFWGCTLGAAALVLALLLTLLSSAPLTRVQVFLFAVGLPVIMVTGAAMGWAIDREISRDWDNATCGVE